MVKDTGASTRSSTYSRAASSKYPYRIRTILRSFHSHYKHIRTKAQEKEKERIANEKKEKFKLKVKKLRDDFNKLKELNNKLPEEIRLTKDELVIDYKYLQIVEKEKEENLEDVENKYRWLKANVNVVISKIQTFLLSSIDSNIVTVFAFRVH